jgi:glucarate dehydratase
MDVACLDIAGKAFGVPVATLLGGVVRERVPYSAYLFYQYEGAGGELAFGTDPNATGWAAARQAAALDPEGIVRWEGYPLLDGHELSEKVIEGLLPAKKG